jgi:hypothetical protein
MINIAVQQARTRFQKISGPLQDAVFSVQTSEMIQQISQRNNIGEDKMAQIGRVVGLVLLGFIHSEDMPAELSERIGISPQAAKAITADFDARLFNPLKKDLESAYSPAPHENEVDAPKIIQEVKRPQPVTMPVASTPKPAPMPISSPAPKPLGQVTSQTAPGINVKAAPLASNKNVAAPAPQAPQASSDKGWSKGTPQNPVVKLGVITPGMPSPTASTTNTGPATSASPKPNAAQQPTGQPQKGMSEFDRLDMMKKPSEPAPVMLHQVSASPQQSSPNFRFDQTAQNQINSASPQKAAPVKAAVIEFASGSASPASAKPASTPPVHYSEYKSTTPPSVSDVPRQVTEIMAPKQQVTAPPPPPPKPTTNAPSTPPPTDQPKKDKVIVQNFL